MEWSWENANHVSLFGKGVTQRETTHSSVPNQLINKLSAYVWADEGVGREGGGGGKVVQALTGVT